MKHGMRGLQFRTLRDAALTLMLLAATAAAWAQPARESAVKAAFLFKFASFVEWPAGTFAQPNQPLVIGVTGDDDVAADLEQLVAGRKLESRPVITKRVGAGPVPAGVHILFVGKGRDRLRETIDAVPGPVLVVADRPDALAAGAVLDFELDGARMRFSASLPAAEGRGLRLSARLLAVATTVEGRKP